MVSRFVLAARYSKRPLAFRSNRRWTAPDLHPAPCLVPLGLSVTPHPQSAVPSGAEASLRTGQALAPIE